MKGLSDNEVEENQQLLFDAANENQEREKQQKSNDANNSSSSVGAWKHRIDDKEDEVIFLQISFLIITSTEDFFLLRILGKS